MFYRRAGIRHLDYRAERQLWPLPFDKLLVGIVVALALAAPFLVDRLYLIAYLLPWLIWSSAALGLNLLMGGAGQIHLGYGAVMAIGAYTSVHLVRLGVPLELAMLAGGLASAVIGVIFGFAALRVKSLYLAMATIAMQYIVDFGITHIPGVSGGGMASIEVPPVRFLGVRIEGDLPTYYMALLVCARDRHVPAQRQSHRIRPGARSDPRKRLCGRNHRHRYLQVQAARRSGPVRSSAASSARCWWSAICAASHRSNSISTCRCSFSPW